MGRGAGLRGSRGRATAGLVAALLLAAGPGVAAPVAARAAGSSGGQSALPSTSPNPLGGGITAPGATPTTTAPTPTVAATSTAGSGSGGGISSASAIGIAVAAVVIIGGISFAIFRDARRRVGGRALHPAADPAERVPGSKRAPKARKLSSAERRRRKRGRAPRRR